MLPFTPESAEQLEVWRVEKTVGAALAHVRHDGKSNAAEAVQVTEAEQGREFAAWTCPLGVEGWDQNVMRL
jgi:hypothetical protein